MNVLLLGGSGFLSGTLARLAVEEGHQVTIVTRGERPVPTSVTAVCADRQHPTALADALKGQGPWDLVVDTIGFREEDARQDVQLFSGRCGALVFISTDFVYDPQQRQVPQPEDASAYLTEGYGGRKRQAEEVFYATDPAQLPWTVFRPGHIYGPGSRLGCLPMHGRDPELISDLRKERPIRLLDGGHFLQHPVFAPDLARACLSVPAASGAPGNILNIANPDVLESRAYYQVIAEILGVPLTVESEPVGPYLEAHPEKASFCCDRVSDLTRLHASGIEMPKTPFTEAIRLHVEAEEGVDQS